MGEGVRSPSPSWLRAENNTQKQRTMINKPKMNEPLSDQNTLRLFTLLRIVAKQSFILNAF